MMRTVQTVNPADAEPDDTAMRRRLRAAGRWASALRCCLLCCLGCGLLPVLHAQQAPSTGPQQLAFAGLRAVANAGQINAIQADATGDLYLLINQGDGVRVLETDPTAANVLATAYIGAKFDVGLAMALDPTGNVYVTGTTDSGALTATAGVAFPSFSGTATNSFVAKWSGSLGAPLFVTFCGGGFMDSSSVAATADAVFITGTLYRATLPVTAAGIIQAPAYGSSWNGFVEKFSASGASLLYATYLSGEGGSTTANAIAADASDDAYIAGTTTASGYPTVAALVPNELVTAAVGATSGFLTKLTPAGDGIAFSTYIPGAGITSLAVDATASNLLLSGSVSLGQFPITNVSTPLTAASYQVLLRMTLDGQTVVGSTVLAPGTQSFVAAGGSGTAWVDGSFVAGMPLLPLTPLATLGNSFALRVNSANRVDQTARFGGVATSDPSSASAPVNLTSVAIDPSGDALFAGNFAPYASSSLLATETYDLPLSDAASSVFSSSVRNIVQPTSACSGTICSAAYLSRLTVPANAASATASLALSVDDAPNLTVRNLGSAQATGVTVSTSGFTQANDCGTTLDAGGECSIALAGSGPGSITVSAANAITQTQSLPALASGTAPLPIVFSPKELDFGVVSSASGAVTRTITVTNLTQQSQSFASQWDIGSKTTLPYTFAQTATDCTLSGSDFLLAPGGSCHITIGLTASSTATNDGPVQQNWLVGARDVQMTAYAQAAALSLSAAEIDFGTQYTGGLRPARYLYLSNNSTASFSHAAVTLPATSPFTVTDRCPATLEPLTVCQIQLAYQNAHTPSADADTLLLDQGLTALVTGRSQPQPAANGASVNPNLSVSATALNFANSVVVTGVSSETHTLTIQNIGTTAFALSLALSGDFTDANNTNCGATLAGGASCSVTFNFVPSQPGTRQGLLAVTAGAGTTPAYVTLSGVGTAILSPVNNGTLNFGGVIAGQPTVQWYKITQPFTSFAVATASATLGSPYTAVIVQDIGYGHGQPASTAFTTSATGSCLNCWVGVQFTPPATGPVTGTLTLTSSTAGSPYVLSLTGYGLPLVGLLLTPVAQDFGPVPINSASASALFALTNLVPGGGAVTVATPAVTGDFSLSNAPSGGASCGGALAYTASCFIQIAFAPAAAGPLTGTLTVQAGRSTATAALTGYGSADPGLSLTPAALVFNNVPGSDATQQTVTLSNTSANAEQIGTAFATTSSSGATSFTASGCINAMLAAGATCTISVTFSATTAPAAGSLTIPVTSTVGGAPVTANYVVPLTGAYTTEDAGLQIVPSDPEYGPQATGATGITRQFTINNLTAKQLTLSIALPRQFVLSGAPCAGLAPFASCNFSVAFLPLDNGDLTGTLFATATPTDGSATLNGLGYVEGYGVGAGALSVTGSILPGRLVSFGTVPSGQASQPQTLTLTNASTSAPLTVRRVTSEWPFLSTTTCGSTLAPAASCTVTLTYTPVNQVATGSNPPPTTADSGELVIESDAVSSPDLIDLTGSSTPVAVTTPSNAPPLAALTPSQSSLTFANTMVGNVSAPQTVTLDNTGTATLTNIGIQTTPDYTVSTGNCASVVPGASCTLTVTFTPQSASQQGSGSGQRISAIEISSNATTSLEFLSLLGVSSPSPLLLGQSALSFGTVLVGASSTQSLQITNTGTSAVTFGAVSAATTLTAASGDYTVVLGNCPQPGQTLAAGTSCTLQVAFAPTQSGTIAGTLSIASSASTLPLAVALSGSGAQSHLQVLPASLSFGPIALGSPASLSLTLSNSGSAPITGIALAVTGDYAVTVPCAVGTLAPGSSCGVTVTFTPTTTGADNSTLTVTSSDATSPDAVPLTGSGISNGSFTLTVGGGASASTTVASGTPAAYTLTVTPVGSFSGTVVLNCTPVAAAQYASCSLLPSSVTLNGTAQNAVATLNTVTEVGTNSFPAGSGSRRRNFGDTALCLLFPALVFTWKARTSRHRAWRRVGPVAWAIFSTIALLTSSGCGSSSSSSNLRYSPAGTYQYQVTASSVSGGAQITQTVTLNLTVQ